MVFTSPASSIKGSRRQVLYSGILTAQAQAQTLPALGSASGGGFPIRQPCRIVGLTVGGGYSGGTAGQTITFSVYKGSVAAGNRAYETVHTQAGAAANFTTLNETVLTAGKEVLAAGDTVNMAVAMSATTGTINIMWWMIEIETDS